MNAAAEISSNPEMASRTLRLVGEETMQRLRDTRVIIFGVGGVGSWCAESLARTGIGHITIVDPDRVAPSNINRQLMATLDTMGRPKVEVLRERMLTVHPECRVTAIQEPFTPESAASFDLDQYDYVIDAIDSLSDKAHLILAATASRARLFSSMGAALKMDPTQVKVAEFWDVKGCPLARALRNKFKRSGQKPRRKFKCVYSDELLHNLGPMGPDELQFGKVAYNGSLCHITAIFGLTLAGLVIKDIMKNEK
ncbi:MAG: tRNA threonylcarbamoyladenosine dehydratase [Bacteroidales bacterium]|nr:tRNA threonylcarbamoyladenosine dehydratase [Bacteroidales bacterium]